MKNMHNKLFGKKGEALAEGYLKKRGIKIIERNKSFGFAEADLIALDGSTLVFIEVKSRESLQYGAPAEAVSTYKQKNYIKMAKVLLMQKKYEGFDVRFDVVSIVGDEVEHIVNAFGNNW